MPHIALRLLALALPLSLCCAAPAQALINRAFVSSRGADALSCGEATAPCRTLQYVHNNIIAAGGEIVVMDAGNYGPVAIAKALSIVNDGAGVASVQQSAIGQNAVSVNAGAADVVHLRGLELEGFGVATTGVYFVSGAALDIDHCVVRRFKNAGVLVTPSANARFSIADSLVSDIGGVGVYVAPAKSLSGLLTRLRVVGAVNGVEVSGRSAATGSNIFVAASDSAATGDNIGFLASSVDAKPVPVLALDRVVAAGDGTGVAVNRGNIRLSRSTVSGNGRGASIALGQISSMGDNSFTDNGSKVVGGSLTRYLAD